MKGGGAAATYEVELVGISKRFADVVAVNNVSLSIAKNEFFSLLGPSGCGKSTILRIIAGLHEPDEGIVKLRGEVANDIPTHKRHTGMVFQHLALFPHMNVFDNIAFGLKMQKTVRSEELSGKVARILQVVDMSGLEKRRMHQLSGGQQQRVALARALVTEPTVLLLDEPLGALDVKIRQMMMTELKRIQKKVGTTFVYVTHDQNEAMTMSDRIAIVNRGVLQQIGTPVEVYEKPENSFVASFIGEANFIEGTYKRGGIFEAKELPTTILVEDADHLGGNSTVFILRHQRVMVGRQLRGLDNVIDGSVEEMTCQGNFIAVKVRVSPSISLSASVPNIEGSRLPYSLGDKVQVGWKKDSGSIIEA